MTFQRTTHVITIGTPVVTLDGETLGTVKEVRGTAFKVNVPGQPDYWLPASSLSGSTTERLMVEALKDQVGDLKVDEATDR